MNSEDSADDILSDANIHSFVVRIWKEETSSETGQEVWRGHITPIPDGTRYYFTNIDQIPSFILGQLKSVH